MVTLNIVRKIAAFTKLSNELENIMKKEIPIQTTRTKINMNTLTRSSCTLYKHHQEFY